MKQSQLVTLSKEVLIAHQKAIESFYKAYAPYSQFNVGACFKIENENMFISGHNIENASFSATMCAERTAIYSGLTQGFRLYEFLVIVAIKGKEEDSKITYPCGNCLQVLSEFCRPTFPIYFGNTKKILEKKILEELLPYSFTSLL